MQAPLSGLSSAFAPCASLRLFFPELLGRHYRRVLYADTDVIFLRDPAEVWSHFRRMGRRQVAALANENEDEE